MSEANNRFRFDGFEERENLGFHYITVAQADRVFEHYLERADGVIDEDGLNDLSQLYDEDDRWHGYHSSSDIELPF